jgi:hypothetical protein
LKQQQLMISQQQQQQQQNRYASKHVDVAPAVGEPSLHRSIAATTGTSATATTVPAAEGDEEVVPTNMELRQQLEHAQDEIRHYRSIIMASNIGYP